MRTNSNLMKVIAGAMFILLLTAFGGCAKKTESEFVYEPEPTTTTSTTTSTTTTTTTTTTIDLRDKNNLTLLTDDEIDLIDGEVNRLSVKNKKAIKNRAGQSNWDMSNINQTANEYGSGNVIDFTDEKTAELAQNIQLKTSVLFNYGSFNKYVKLSNSISENYTSRSEEYIIQESLEVMKQINTILSSIPEESRQYAKFMVVGYTDSSYIGYKPDTSKQSWDFNKELSEKRANTIKDILINQFGVNEANIQDYGMSFANPIIGSNGQIDQNASRRTEILVSY